MLNQHPCKQSSQRTIKLFAYGYVATAKHIFSGYATAHKVFYTPVLKKKVLRHGDIHPSACKHSCARHGI